MEPEKFTAFADNQQITRGDLPQITGIVKSIQLADKTRRILVFSDQTGQQVDIDLRETAPIPPPSLEPTTETITSAPKPRGPGRPKLGVVGREITLLPRHWKWLNVQPGGPSVALRKLVEQARRASQDKDKIRLSRNAAFRFMSAVAGNEPGFEEACRALFAGNRQGFTAQTQDWPTDVRDYAQMLAVDAFGDLQKEN